MNNIEFFMHFHFFVFCLIPEILNASFNLFLCTRLFWVANILSRQRRLLQETCKTWKRAAHKSSEIDNSGILLFYVPLSNVFEITIHYIFVHENLPNWFLTYCTNFVAMVPVNQFALRRNLSQLLLRKTDEPWFLKAFHYLNGGCSNSS